MLINCVVYQDGKKVADIPVDDVSNHLARPGCFVWVALLDATDTELTQMQQEFGLHDLAVEDARHGHQRPKIEEYGDTLFTVMQLIESDHGEWKVGEMAVFVGRNFVLSSRLRNSQTFSGVRERCEREPELMKHGAGFVFYALMDAVVDRYFPMLDSVETELETIEEKIFDHGAARHNVQRLYSLKRRTTLLRHAVAPLLEVVGNLHGGRVPDVCVETQAYFRDIEDHLARINGSIDAIRDTIDTAIHVNLSMVTIADGETTKRLAAWAAIFGVSTAMVGVWGMNFEHMPELKWTFGYPLALGLIVAAGVLMHWRFRRAGWL